MNNSLKIEKAVWLIVAALMLFSVDAYAQSDGFSRNSLIFGFKLRAGGRFDNVRMCVASDPGTKGGMAMDISFFTEIGLTDKMSIVIDIPVMRPILFATAFKMLQFEPEVTLNFRNISSGKVDLVAGPTIGVIFHYGPDYNSEASGSQRGNSFFAIGPKIGGYLGLDFKRAHETFNFQLGISPYISPLFSVNDSDNHRGIVAGGTLDGLFRFSAK
jgi:hypothetical protein